MIFLMSLLCDPKYIMMFTDNLQVLRCYETEWIIEIKDITESVHEQYEYVKSNQLDKLMVAKERVYLVADSDTAAQIGVDSIHE